MLKLWITLLKKASIIHWFDRLIAGERPKEVLLWKSRNQRPRVVKAIIGMCTENFVLFLHDGHILTYWTHVLKYRRHALYFPKHDFIISNYYIIELFHLISKLQHLLMFCTHFFSKVNPRTLFSGKESARAFYSSRNNVIKTSTSEFCNTYWQSLWGGGTNMPVLFSES